jgi:26S proteasome regulatory subunit N1
MPSTDPKDSEMDVESTDGADKAVVKSDKKSEDKKDAGDELSEEDAALKEGLELAVIRLEEDDSSLHKQALDHLVTEIRSATSSMTSVPKPLKFLHPHYATLKSIYEKWPITHDMKKIMADMLSVLAMTMSEKGSFECLKFKLAGTQINISSWGHEYVRYLSGEISEEYNRRLLNVNELAEESDGDVDDLLVLVDDIIPFQMSHNSEAEAADLLIEVQQLKKLIEMPVVDDQNYERLCLYLLRSADFMSDPDDLFNILQTCFTIFKTQRKYSDAMRVALKMDDNDKITEVFDAVNEAVSQGLIPADGQLESGSVWRKQLSFLLARHRSNYEMPEANDSDDLREIVGNVNLSDMFVSVARDMDVLEPKTAETIYKQGDGPRRGTGNTPAPESARANIATSFVNGFVNAGYGEDKLMTPEECQAGLTWACGHNKDHFIISATASLGVIMLWNVQEGLNKIDSFLHHSDTYVRAGAMMGVGIMSTGITDDIDAAMALSEEKLEDPSSVIRTATICGLGIAYAGSKKENLEELLIPIVSGESENDVPFSEVCFAALTLGLSFVGTCHLEIAGVIVQRIMESDEELNQSISKMLAVGLGLLFLGKTESCDATLEALGCIEHSRAKYAAVTLESFAYAGTGNVLQVQKLLKMCAERLTEDADHQAAAVIGISLIAIGEEMGIEMSLRTFEHLLHYGELPVRRLVPLAIALLYISNPDYAIVDQLSRLSHDSDPELAMAAIFGLGLVSAGSNNSRVAGLLRNLADLNAKEADHLFLVRIAQGLNASAKGLVSFSPFHSDR